MKRKISHAEFKKQLLKDQAVADAYDAMDEEYQLIRDMLRLRQERGLTQAAIAKAMHTTPSVVSRIESMHVTGRPSPSLATLKRYAHALGCRLQIKFVPEEQEASHC